MTDYVVLKILLHLKKPLLIMRASKNLVQIRLRMNKS